MISYVCDRGLRRKRRFEVLDEKGLMVPAIIPDTKIELVVMSDIFVEKNFKVTLMVNHDGS